MMIGGKRGIRRVVDVIVVLLAAPVVLPVCGILLLLIMHDSPGPGMFVQQRVGRNGQPFALYKLRTMTTGVGDLPTHEATKAAITRFGKFLRRSKLDELPQLWNILRGEMSFVGPRPCLVTQEAVIAARRAHGLMEVLPGVTGPAQVRDIDMSTPELMAQVEAEYFARATLASDFGLIIRTAMGAGSGDVIGKK